MPLALRRSGRFLFGASRGVRKIEFLSWTGAGGNAGAKAFRNHNRSYRLDAHGKPAIQFPGRCGADRGDRIIAN
jgi:hypothetical protein